MQNKWICFFMVAFLLFNFLPTKVLASDTEELGYDDLVSQLSEKREQSRKKTNESTGPVHSHLGLSVLNSWDQISKNGHTATVNPSGFGISTGMDLNSDRYRLEGEFRNFSDMNRGSQSGSLRELAGEFQYRRPFSPGWDVKFEGGLALRLLNFTDSAQDIDVSDTSSMFIAGAGLEARLSQSVAIGGDLTTHLPFGPATSDRNSVDFGLKLDTTF